MPYHVPALRNINGELYRYIFYFVEWNQFRDPVRDEIDRQGDAFGVALGEYGAFVRASPSYEEAVASEVRDRWEDEEAHEWWPEEVRNTEWSGEILQRIDNDGEPILLVTGGMQFGDFAPWRDEFAIIWLSDFDGKPETIKPMLLRLANVVRNGKDVIEYLRDIAIREQERDQVGEALRRGGLLARVASYVEIQPRIFGVSIDLKAILRDFAEGRAAS
jgi:hypothetical protein